MSSNTWHSLIRTLQARNELAGVAGPDLLQVERVSAELRVKIRGFVLFKGDLWAIPRLLLILLLTNG